MLGLCSDCARTVLGLLGLCSDYVQTIRTARTVLGVHSDYVGEGKVLEVETIHGHRKQERGYQYYIQWWVYPIFNTSWEPEHAFSNDGKILADYKKHHHL